MTKIELQEIPAIKNIDQPELGKKKEAPLNVQSKWVKVKTIEMWKQVNWYETLHRICLQNIIHTQDTRGKNWPLENMNNRRLTPEYELYLDNHFNNFFLFPTLVFYITAERK